MSDSEQVSQDGNGFHILQERLALAFWKWKVWKQLFVHEPDQREEVQRLMKRQASAFFALIHQVLLDDVVLSICKLADPAEHPSKGEQRPNLTIRRAVNEAADRLGAAQTEVETQLGELNKAVEGLKKRRNRSIAHDDLAIATKMETFDPLRFDTIEQSLQLAMAIMSRLHPDDSSHEYDRLIATGDGESLIQSLRWAEKHVQAARARHERP